MYKPETRFQIDDNCVYNLKHKGWWKGEPEMVNDVAINITARHIPEEDRKQIAKIICDALNNFYFNKPVQPAHAPEQA